MALGKICFPEFNRNIGIDKHPALIVDSTNLRYDIIFGSDFLYKCGITLDYENRQVQWLEYTILLRNATEFFSFTYYYTILSPLEFEFETDLIGNQIVDSFATRILDAKYEQANIHDVAFNQTHLTLDQRQDLFTILSKDKNCLMAPLESIRTKRSTLTSNLELSQCITVLSLFLTYTDKPLKRNLITWLSLACLQLA